MKIEQLFLFPFLLLVMLLTSSRMVGETPTDITFYVHISETDSLRFGLLDGDSAILKENAYPPTCDSLVIPETVQYNNTTYRVTTIDEYAFADYPISSLTLPSSISTIIITDANPFCTKSLQNIYVNESNPYFCSVDGVLYSKDTTTLHNYPNKTDKNVVIPEGVKVLAPYSMRNMKDIETLEFPLTLKEIGLRCLHNIQSKLQQVIIKDSVEQIDSLALRGWILEKVVLGSGLKSVHSHFLTNNDTLNMVCYAKTPPTIFGQQTLHIASKINLFVPRASYSSYCKAVGWRDCAHINVIEPPVVSTEEGVTISWVQSFSATGYVWYLYKDEAHTQLAMSLAFDKDGRLQEIVLNSPAPQRVEAEDVEEGNNEAERFAEYFSFTIKNLSANTNYYYLRQTLCQGEVIETEEGTFNTTPDTPTAIQDPTPSLPAIEGEDKVTKILQDGTILLLRNGKRYGICGEERQ